jgi:glycosyltransferase involved in cell wall biosynthesis
MTDIQLLVLAPYPLQRVPGQRYRFEQYLDVWRDAGIVPTVRTVLDDAAMDHLYSAGQVPQKVAAVARGFVRRLGDLRVARRFDAAYVFREAFPVGPPWVERALGRLGIPYIYDFDDAIWLPNTAEANRFIAPLKLPVKVRSLVGRAALVTAGNEYLASWARQHQHNVWVVPTTIDIASYGDPVDKSDSAGPLRIGWTGSTTTIQHLRTIERVLRELQEERGVILRVIGDPSYRLPGAEVEVLPWREATEADDLRPIDIGIMPLPDDEWARGKCGAKALQYMGLGIPTVMSPVGVNTAIADGGAALLASTPEEWKAALLRLLDDPALRRQLGVAGRRRVQEGYSVEAVAPLYIDAVRTVVGRR